MKKVIGITGTIGSGKTTVCEYLKIKGYKVISSDHISHELTKVNQKGYNLIVEKFEDILDDNLNINRKKLANIIFNNEEKRQLLNTLLHPIIKEQITTNINLLNDKLIFVDIPLLFEAKFEEICDLIVCISTNLELNLKRTALRDNINITKVKKIIATQMPLEEKEAKSDFVINNTKDFKYLYEQVDDMLEKIN